MKSDAEIALQRVQSEVLGALASIQSYQVITPAYFDRLRHAVADAVSLFVSEGHAPPSMVDELDASAEVLRNEATAFPGRTAACVEMADWLDAQAVRIRHR